MSKHRVMTIRMSEQLHRRLMETAAQRRISANTLALQALSAYVVLNAAQTGPAFPDTPFPEEEQKGTE